MFSIGAIHHSHPSKDVIKLHKPSGYLAAQVKEATEWATNRYYEALGGRREGISDSDGACVERMRVAAVTRAPMACRSIQCTNRQPWRNARAKGLVDPR